MSESVIEVHNVSKRYRIGSAQNQHSAFKQTLDIFWEPIKRLRSLARNQLPTDADHEIWALKDISFNVEKGETLGLIGTNGSGKSTMLKIISNVVRPSEGHVRTVGRISSLLEVGAGFNPELTGRENVYLKGMLHGMTRAEVNSYYDRIVDFSEISQFMDTPMKRYSSGMKVRLGFSVAAMMNPDIFIVDEAFAVGDVAFREKCMSEIERIHRMGKTVLVVSHSMGHITRLCDRIIWLEKGQIIMQGSVEDVSSSYLQKTVEAKQKELKLERRKERADTIAKGEFYENPGHLIAGPNNDKPMTIREVKLLDAELSINDEFDFADGLTVEVTYDVNKPTRGHLIIFVNAYPSNFRVLGIGDADTDETWRNERQPGQYTARLKIPPKWLNAGLYTLTITVSMPYISIYDRHDKVLEFEINDRHSSRPDWYMKGPRPGAIGLDLPWEYIGDSPVKSTQKQESKS